MSDNLMFVGTYGEQLGHVDGKGEGIYALRFDRDNLTISDAGGFLGRPQLTSLKNPTFLTTHRDAASGELCLYIVDERHDGPGCIASARVDERSGELHLLAPATLEPATPECAALFCGDACLLAEDTEPLFHEAGVWIPQTGEWLVTSNRLKAETPETHVRILAVTPGGRVRFLGELEAKIVMGNGGTSDGSGGAYLLSQGLEAESGTIWQVDARLGSATLVGPRGGTQLDPPNVGDKRGRDDLLFNSMNDVVLHKGSRTLIFTDPAYGHAVQGFRTTFNGHNAVWQVDPEGSRWSLIDSGFHAPNGVLLSPDEKTLYVTDVWNGKWHTTQPQAEQLARHVVRYDVSGGEGGAPLAFSNRRIFFDLVAESNSEGFPDGIKADERGNVYVGCGDGVRIYRPDGAHLGRIKIEGGCANLCFGGPDGRMLLILCETRAIVVPMAVRGDPRLGPFTP